MTQFYGNGFNNNPQNYGAFIPQQNINTWGGNGFGNLPNTPPFFGNNQPAYSTGVQNQTGVGVFMPLLSGVMQAILGGGSDIKKGDQQDSEKKLPDFLQVDNVVTFGKDKKPIGEGDEETPVVYYGLPDEGGKKYRLFNAQGTSAGIFTAPRQKDDDE